MHTENLKIPYPAPKMPWYVDWFCEWLCLIQTLCMIVTICKWNPQIEWAFIEWWTERRRRSADRPVPGGE